MATWAVVSGFDEKGYGDPLGIDESDSVRCGDKHVIRPALAWDREWMGMGIGWG